MSRSYYDIQQVCLNGHQITDRYTDRPQHRRDYCGECGAETIHECPACGEPIPGEYVVPSVAVIGKGTASVPSHCEGCGEPFPWAKDGSGAEGSLENEGDELLASDLRILRTLCARFHAVVRQLQERHNDRHTLIVHDEYDVQDLLHALLRLFFDDVRAEEYSPSYAGQSSRIDFLLKNERVVVETKMTREGVEDSDIGDELLVDIDRYSSHPSAERLFCFVYDPAHRLTNPRGLEGDLTESREGLQVDVVIEPH